VQLLAGMLAGLLQVRLFIFYHDAVHGALFRKDPVAAVIMSVIGFYLMAVRSVWKESHDFHHQHNGKIASSAIGSFPILSQEAIKSTPAGQLRAYALVRHPLSIAGGYFTVFILGMAVMPFLRRPGRHWVAPVSVVVHLLLVVAAVYWLGWVTAVCALVVPAMLSMALGSYLFYAQHNFPAMQIRTGTDWDYVTAALRGSSMFRMSRLMHWFTGNIGFHHVHHVNHRIPFYRLRETMLAIPELQDPGCTSWRIGDVLACLRLYAWDARQGRMLTYAESRSAA
jgi:omega-6 fatty acid desaturase (delta-12 desaturase)